jgi:hypothetical protein
LGERNPLKILVGKFPTLIDSVERTKQKKYFSFHSPLFRGKESLDDAQEVNHNAYMISLVTPIEQ